jgi:glycosyltransferase involved in cell wall biosynthesis
VVDPGDADGFVSAARTLIDETGPRIRMGEAARQAAERNFDIDRITDEFVDVLASALGHPIAGLAAGPGERIADESPAPC